MNTDQLTLTFTALADPTRRRDPRAARRWRRREPEIAAPFPIRCRPCPSTSRCWRGGADRAREAPAVAALADSGRRRSRRPRAFLDDYRQFWDESFDRLGEHSRRLRSHHAGLHGHPAQVWAAWTEPAELARWWGKRGWNARRLGPRRAPRRGVPRHDRQRRGRQRDDQRRDLQRGRRANRLVLGETMVTFTDLGDGRTEMLFQTTRQARDLPHDKAAWRARSSGSRRPWRAREDRHRRGLRRHPVQRLRPRERVLRRGARPGALRALGQQARRRVRDRHADARADRSPTRSASSSTPPRTRSRCTSRTSRPPAPSSRQGRRVHGRHDRQRRLPHGPLPRPRRQRADAPPPVRAAGLDPRAA